MGNTQLRSCKALRASCRRNPHSGFSLVEVLIAISVIGVLSTLTVVAVGKARNHAESARSIGSAKALISAFLMHSADNGGSYFVGYDSSAGTSLNQTFFRGKELTGEEAHRYPLRLAQYFNDDINGAILSGYNRQQLEDMQSFKGSMRNYGISMFPAFGMNMNFVGGRKTREGLYTEPTAQEGILHSTDAEGRIIVFASAGKRGSDFGASKYDVINGYHEVIAPKWIGSSWNGGKWRERSNPSDYGNLDARYDGKVAVAFIDGSMALHTVEELRDMRLWSRMAVISNNKNYQPTYNPVFER